MEFVVLHRKKTGISQKELKEFFDYREDGNLIWKVQRGSGAFPGKTAGTPNTHRGGRLQVSIFGERIQIANVIWCWHTGVWPQNENLYVDHINRDASDNRYPDNLRLVSHSENMKNTSRSKGDESASVMLNGTEIHLGRFNSYEARYVEIGAKKIIDFLKSIGKL